MLNHSLNKIVLDADGRYLEAQEIQVVEQYAQSYRERLTAYQQLRDRGEALVIGALRRLAQTYPDVIRQHGARCKYDMSEMMRYIALSILKDDELFFREQLMVWFDTVLLAHKRTQHCAIAYQYLQTEVARNLLTSTATQVNPYLELLIQTLKAHA